MAQWVLVNPAQSLYLECLVNNGVIVAGLAAFCLGVSVICPRGASRRNSWVTCWPACRGARGSACTVLTQIVLLMHQLGQAGGYIPITSRYSHPGTMRYIPITDRYRSCHKVGHWVQIRTQINTTIRNREIQTRGYLATRG